MTTSPGTGFETTDETDDDDDSADASSSSGKIDTTGGTWDGTWGSTAGGDNVCGNGIAEPTEGCDGKDFGGVTCVDFEFEGGRLGCGAACNILTDACATCGDGVAGLVEFCDGADFRKETCMSQGFGGGMLQCAPDCAALITTGCTPLASCGDGTRNGVEQCDGTDLGGASCTSQGFDMGQIGCNPGACTFNLAGCSNLTCGQQGDFCIASEQNPQSSCCDAGVGGNIFGICAVVFCT